MTVTTAPQRASSGPRRVKRRPRSDAKRPPDAPIRVVVGDGDPLYQAGMTHVLEQAGVEVVASASNADDLTRKARAHHPDVAVVDLELPPSLSSEECVEAVRSIRSIDPRMAVLVLSEFADEQYALAVLGDQPQGFGYLLKARIWEIEDFTSAVSRVASGGTAIDPTLVSRMADPGRSDDAIDDLTDRERVVLALIAEGRSNGHIADELVVTVAAVERHISSIFSKLDLRPDRADNRRVLAALRYHGR
jgi:DNA-binding NarL/FixJ family response regulator